MQLPLVPKRKIDYLLLNWDPLHDSEQSNCGKLKPTEQTEMTKLMDTREARHPETQPAWFFVWLVFVLIFFF